MISRPADHPRKVSLLLPNKDNAAILRFVLDRLEANTTYPAVELIAVDDGSSDASVEILERSRARGWLDEFHILENRGTGAIDALNLALGAATGEICVQLDADASVETPGWIETMLTLLDTDPLAGVVTAKVVMDTGELHACGVGIVRADGWCDLPARVAEPVGRRHWHHRLIRPLEGHGGASELRPTEVDAGIGCCMMYRRDEALAVGGYDTEFSPVWFDDVDLTLAIRASGKKVFCLPEVRVVHHISSRTPPRPSSERWKPRRVARALARRTAKGLPVRTKSFIERHVDVDLEMHFTKAQRARLRHHYAYWQHKWGWDPRNPDLGEIERRWGHTELWWAADSARRANGERIIAEYARGRRGSDSAVLDL